MTAIAADHPWPLDPRAPLIGADHAQLGADRTVCFTYQQEHWLIRSTHTGLFYYNTRGRSNHSFTEHPVHAFPFGCQADAEAWVRTLRHDGYVVAVERHDWSDQRQRHWLNRR